MTILAQTPESWTGPAPMPWLEILGIFVGLPALMLLLIIIGVMAPSMVKGGGNRTGLSWWAAPQWFGTRPEDPEHSAPADSTDAAAGSGAGSAAGSGTEEHVVTGGVGARW